MLHGLETLSISDWVATSDWGYPLLLSVHSIGMATVVGLLVMLDLRVLGLAKSIPLSAFSRLMPVAWLGFFVNLASGTLLFMSLATHLVSNWPFLSKMATICLGGLVSWLLWHVLRRNGSGGAQDGEDFDGDTIAVGTDPDAAFAVSAGARAIAVASLLIWFCAILFGRLIAYVLDAALLQGS